MSFIPIEVTVELESGPVTATATGLDYIAYEDTFDRSFNQDLSTGRYKLDLFVAWSALHRAGKIEMTFDEFLALTPNVVVESVQEPVPLEEQTTHIS